MAIIAEDVLRDQLLQRRRRLTSAIATSNEEGRLASLLGEVDQALERMENGTYGICEACNESVESERLLADPLVRLCLDHLTPSQRAELEEDLELAARIQKALLPNSARRSAGWHAAFHYQPAGLVSGDYCDLVTAEDGSIYFMLGDVSGKGVAASMLMSHLHAMFRTLIPSSLPLGLLVERASRIFCESTLPSQFATLVIGRAEPGGGVEVCNAGHLPPLVLREGSIETLPSNGLPIGIFHREEFTASRLQLARGEGILLYSDGVSEATDESDREYGRDQLAEFASAHRRDSPEALINGLVGDVMRFRNGTPRRDDVSVMTVRREG